jgi:hypothetical protein
VHRRMRRALHARHPLHVWARLALVALTAIVLVAGTTGEAPAQGSLTIRVRGTAKIEARAARADGALALSGTLTDDAGRPLPSETLTILVTRETDPRDAATAEALRSARACEGGAGAGDRPRPTAYGVRVGGPSDAPEVIVITDEDGRFCFRAGLPPDRYAAHLSWRGAELIDRADARLAFDTSRQALVLRFDPPPRLVSLDAPEASFEVVATVDEDGVPRVAAGLPIVLAAEGARGGPEVPLGTETTDDTGRARFAVPPLRLGPPGRGELRASATGNADVGFASRALEIERRSKVAVRVPAADRGELSPAVPEDGIPLLVEVSSVAGRVGEGGVEARIGDEVVGAAPVEDGLAHLTLTFAAQGEEALVHLRYVPVSPWYEPLGEPMVRLPIRSPGLAAKAPVVVAGLAVLAFFLLGRLTSSRRAKAETRPSREVPAAREAKPRLEVVRAAARGESGWRGRIVDAHDGSPVAGARVFIERGTFEGKSVLASTVAGADGTFELPSLESQGGGTRAVGGEVLGAEGRLHARLLQPLPGAGELAIMLVLRRRAILGRLVAWARRVGAPFDARPEPTPGHVRRAAAGDPETAQWAEAVERAVYGAGEVDAEAESELDRLAPRPEGSQRRAETPARSGDPPDRR